MAGPRTQRKTKEIVKTFKDHRPHRRNNKSECQECTCKIGASIKPEHGTFRNIPEHEKIKIIFLNKKKKKIIIIK